MQLSDEDRERFVRDLRRQVTPTQIANWIADARRITEMVNKGNQDVIPVFWIRLFGVLDDIGEYINRQVDTLQSHPDLGSVGPTALQSVLPCQRAVEELRAAFSEDELIWIQYRRHCDSHPLQDAYRIRLNKKATGLSDKVKHKLLGAELTVEETKTRLHATLNQYGSDEHLLARRFAGRALPLIERLRRASEGWFGESTIAHEPTQGRSVKRFRPWFAVGLAVLAIASVWFIWKRASPLHRDSEILAAASVDSNSEVERNAGHGSVLGHFDGKYRDYCLEWVKRGRRDLVILQSCRPGDHRRLAEVDISPVGLGEFVSFGIINGCALKDEGDPTIIGIVKRGCGELDPHVLRAWRVVPERATFLPMATVDVACMNGACAD